MSPPIATPRSRALGFGLRKARLARGCGLRELARATDVYPAELSNWELGLRVPKLEEVALLLGQLRVGLAERNRLLELAEHAREPNWLESTMPGAPADVSAYVEYERTASAMLSWEPNLVPGLLQTREYVRRIVAEPGRGPDEVDRRTEIRLARQKRLRGRDPLQYSVLIGESAIRQGLGGPTVMAEQLRRLLFELDRPNIGLRIVPATELGHPGLHGSFTVLEFIGLPPIVFLEQYRASAYLYDDDQIAAYRAAAKTLASLALSEPDSARYLREVIAELEA
ncbi:Helix-turn-helix [Amycolatopsis pretoriensis]|uniref:Helix-turn-helix n=1 Tax=Amycolatopsis pretoriensis TaxID=218821 RepID=A0A1H5QR19_9PSEU|nr:helix-turn-helix transcriptional regulator [Amycolatopsis pretoriensis]SEF28509.1 Helix-turn-helix [Amycolatopsis pretoriensis]